MPLTEASAEAQRMESAPPELSEAGAPPFAVFGREALGLSSSPSDLQLLPDGRLLVFAKGQIVLGDGIRWETFRQAPNSPTISVANLAVERDGEIFTATSGGFARVDFGEDGYWRLVNVEPRPKGAISAESSPYSLIEAGDEWFWHNGGNSVLSWRPGQVARVIEATHTVEHIFALKGQTFLSYQTEGRLYRLAGTALNPVVGDHPVVPDDSITCAQAYDDNTMLVGTQSSGLRLFDGHAMHQFLEQGILAGGMRINDLCPTEGGLFAVAVENYGIVFFDHRGRIVQALDRTLDHRLSRVKQLLPAPGGVVWALLNDGVLRVEFPSRTSNFEPLVGTGVTTARPFRLDGRLWVLADGKTSRGVYDQEGRLTHFESDTPAGAYVFSFSTALGLPIAGTSIGTYYRNAKTWVLFAPETVNLRLLDHTPINGRWLYGARNEIGWLELTPTGIGIERFPVPDLQNVFNSSLDQAGNFWIEMGVGSVGRVRLEQDRPVFESFGKADGVPDGWAQVYALDGLAGFNVADQILRFNEATRRFVSDRSFSFRYPGLNDVVGRPGFDVQGRLWITANGGVQVLAGRDGTWKNLREEMPPGFRPYFFRFENNGVVWMIGERRLARYDPSLPLVPRQSSRAIITHVNLVGSNRTLFPKQGRLPPLDYSDTTLKVDFMAPGNSPASPVSFEVNLEGAGSSGWASTGGTGTALFNRLKEGKYLLRVRPRLGDIIGTEATLAFTIRPPWFRSPLAYSGYALVSLATILFGIWLVTYLQRRENTRLEGLVTRRTGELEESNRLLARQVGEIQMLSQAIAQSPVAVLILGPDNTIVFANPRAAELSGYTIDELIGRNVRQLRSDLVTPELLDELSATVQRGETWHGQLANRRKDGSVVHVRTSLSPIRSPDSPARLSLLLEEDISEWLADQERRDRLEAQLFQAQKLESLGTLAGGIAHDFNNILTGILGYCELAGFSAGPDPELRSHLREIRTAGLRARDLVAQILTFSRRGLTQLVPLDLAQPVAEALKLIRASTPATIEISSRLESGTILADSTQIQQVVLNLCTNAVHAMRDKPGQLDVTLQRLSVDERLAAETTNLATGPCLRLTVTDTGHGMDASTRARIFDPFFTTKPQGEGTGLGLSIVEGVLASHHGALRVRSEPGKGSTFELYFPLSSKEEPPTASTGPAPRGKEQEILVVDDEPAVATFVSSRLKQLGYRTTAFHDPRDALAAFKADPARFQAIVTDLTMPHLTGVALIEQTRALGPVIPAIIITGYGHDAGGTSLQALPRCQVLSKPFTGDDLAHVLSQLLNRR